MGTVYVLGAGVDCALGFPLASNLMSELDQFVKGDGRAASRAVKDKLGGGRRVRFSFEKYVETQGRIPWKLSSTIKIWWTLFKLL